MHCGAEVTESSTNKQHHISQIQDIRTTNQSTTIINNSVYDGSFSGELFAI
jgi:hypothetical protein